MLDYGYRTKCRREDCQAAIGKPCTNGDTRGRRTERKIPHRERQVFGPLVADKERRIGTK